MATTSIIQATGRVTRAASGGSTVVGLGGNEVLVGSASDDVFYEGNARGGLIAADVYGNGSLDRVFGTSGQLVFHTADLFRQSAAAFVEASATLPSQVAVIGPSQGLLGLGLSDISFIDGTMSYGAMAPAAQITRLYMAALGRAPDPAGLQNYVSLLKGGKSLSVLADAMLSGPEAQARLGVTDGVGFVTKIYQSALGRSPEAKGLAEKVAQLSNGVSRTTVLLGISESPESQAHSGTGGGVFIPSESAAEIAGFYDTAFKHAPDAAGLIARVSSLTDMSFSAVVVPLNVRMGIIAEGLAQSAEFTKLYANVTDADFIQMLYQNALARGPTPGEAADLRQQLSAGANRGTVLYEISGKPEHMALLAPKYQQGIFTLG